MPGRSLARFEYFAVSADKAPVDPFIEMPTGKREVIAFSIYRGTSRRLNLCLPISYRAKTIGLKCRLTVSPPMKKPGEMPGSQLPQNLD
jgi:hypothetical protein